MEYQALYRKYRPKNFNEVVGQKITLQILKNSIKNDHISHAYLFYGPRGTGKTSIAKILARTINCENPVDGIPCEKCDSCIASKNQNCVDIIEIDAASNNGVDEIRELKNKISFVPTELKYKVYIVDEVHMLSTGAFNALLKTLEEPPQYAIFILATTELQKVPLTIISRCQTLEFKRIDDKSMYDKIKEISTMEKIKIDDSGIYEICKYSNGGLRDAIGILEKSCAYTDELINDLTIKEISGNISQEELDKFIDLYKNKNVESILNLIDQYYSNGIDLIKLANSIIDSLRDNMINNKNYDKNICNIIYNLDDMVSIMEKSENPKIIFEVTMINNLIEQKIDDNIKPDDKVEKKAISENKIIQTEKNNEIDLNLKEIRVGNTLCDADKSIISNIRKNWDNIKNYSFDSELGNISRILSSDINPVAASKTNVILISKLKGLSTQLNNDLNTIEKIFKMAFNEEYKVICISEEEWKKYIEEYKNDKSKFKYVVEKNNKVNTSNKSLKEKAKELFDD